MTHNIEEYFKQDAKKNHRGKLYKIIKNKKSEKNYKFGHIEI